MSRPDDPQPETSPAGPAREPVSGLEAPGSYAEFVENPDRWIIPILFSFVESVTWDSEGGPGPALTNVTGTLTLLIPLQFNFTYFTLNGVEFAISSGGTPGSSTVDFGYDGPLSFSLIKAQFVSGEKVEFGSA